ncbi:hypothetical protein ACFFW8_26850 [Erwinia tracheiphila]
MDKLNITHSALRAAVIGAGPMGLLYLWSLHLRGVTAFIVEKNPHRLAFARGVLPEGCCLYTNFAEAMACEYGNDALLDLCVDTTGYLAETVFTRLAPGGKILNVALKDATANLDVLKIADKSLSIIGSIDSLNNSFERAYALIRDGKIPAERLVSHHFTFDDYQKAFATVGCDIDGKTLRPITEPGCKVMLHIRSQEKEEQI